MKNIYLLATDKPSRLLKDLVDKTYQFKKEVLYGNRFELPLNIYITSDSDLDINDWVTDGKDIWQVSYILADNIQQSKKIILTTDQDLIKDGVQAIDDEFLEWFCKNSSYEWVEVKSLKTIPALQLTGNNHCMYQLIVPKEEESDYNGKQEIKWISENQSCKQIDSCYNSLSKKCICPKEEPKQETLEEAKIEYHFENDIEMFEFMNEMASTGKIPKKWSLFVSKINDLYRQQERMYSEEELLQILESHKDNLEFDKDKFEHDRWFEQFKKK